MSVSDAIRRMLDAGLTLEHALIAAGICEAELAVAETDTRTARQKRNARYYEKRTSEKRLKASEQDGSDADPVSPKEIPQTPLEITPSPVSPATPKGVSAPSPRTELEAVLSPSQASAVIDHRKRIGKPMTPRAAHLLAGKFAQCPDPNAAADAMIANGWQGFEPAWMHDRQRARGSPARTPTAQELLKAQRESYPHDEPAPNRPILIASR